MKYYKVKPSCDQLGYATGKRGLGHLIGKELYTQKEVSKIFISIAFKDAFDIVEISSKRTYFFFGARFETTLS